MAVVSEQVAVSLAAAVAAVAAVVLVAVAADSVVPSLLSWWPRSFQLTGPMSWPRDSCLGRMLVCRPSPTRRPPLRIPEPMEVVSDWSLADSAVLCRLAEVA